ECIILDQYLDEACDTETAEMVFGEMVENGNDPSGLGINLNQEQVNKAYEKARELFLTQTSIIRNDVEKNNDRFVESRLNSLKTSYTKNLNKQRDLLVRAQGEGRQDRYLRMLTGTIKRLERELSSKQSELELRRKVEVGWDEVAAGILEVV
ncbi:MAG: hypothetical protein GYA14_14580, partial [Ignavibacteria bacterium]|nr:hypothetical protein [Ignavibacteria bacterium]